MVLLTVVTARGTERRCDRICHDAKGKSCGCVCGGRFHGIGATAALRVTWEELDEARQRIELGEGEHVQLRVGG